MGPTRKPTLTQLATPFAALTRTMTTVTATTSAGSLPTEMLTKVTTTTGRFTWGPSKAHRSRGLGGLKTTHLTYSSYNKRSLTTKRSLMLSMFEMADVAARSFQYPDHT